MASQIKGVIIIHINWNWLFLWIWVYTPINFVDYEKGDQKIDKTSSKKAIKLNSIYENENTKYVRNDILSKYRIYISSFEH